MNLKTYQNLFTDSDFKKIQEFSNIYFESKNYTTNKKWNHGIKLNSKPVLIHNIKDENLHTIIKDNLISAGINLEPKGMLFYYWKEGSYIPWHTDVSHIAGLTVYLNEYWNYKNGGLFLYELGGEIKTIIPQKNLGVLQEGGVPHSTTIVSNKNKIRKTLQIFFDKKIRQDSYII